MELPWLESFARNWRSRALQGRVPHAVLLQGTSGVGKRAAAAWLAAEKIKPGAASAAPQFPPAFPEHADLRWIAPPQDKHVIGVDAIRGLVDDLSLTSYEGGGKVAVIEPANAMTVNAANSLLKTLEEPPGDTLLILVADNVGRIPATILSRCQRIIIGVPATSESLAWLAKLHPGDNWAEALRLAGNAPLAAIQAAENLELTRAMAREFAALPQSGASPLDVAAKWSKQQPQFVLDWLGAEVRDCICRLLAGAASARKTVVPDSVLRCIDRRKLFCYLDIINRLRNQPAGSFNVQLTVESLLIDWADGLRDCDRMGDFANRSLNFGLR